MMVYTKNLVLVCTGRDTARAAGQGMPVLHLCLGITPKGASLSGDFVVSFLMIQVLIFCVPETSPACST